MEFNSGLNILSGSLDSATRLWYEQYIGVLIVFSIATLLVCFFGYKTLRIFITITGVIAGFFIGAGISQELDFGNIIGIIAVLICILVCGFLAFRLFKAGVFIYIAALTFIIVWIVFGGTRNASSIAAIVAIAAGIVSLFLIRPVVIFSTGIFGGFGSAMFLLPIFMIFSDIAAIIVGLVLSVAGIYVQFKTTRNPEVVKQGVSFDIDRYRNNIAVKYILKTLPLIILVVTLTLLSLLLDNGICVFISHTLCLLIAVLAMLHIDIRGGLTVTILYTLIYVMYGNGYALYLLLDIAFIFIARTLLSKFNEFKVKTGAFTAVGVGYSILMYAFRGDTRRHNFDGTGVIGTVVYYVLLCVSVYLLLEFVWPIIKPKTPKKILEVLTEME